MDSHAPYAQWLDTAVATMAPVPASVHITPSALSLEVAETATLTAYALGSDGLPLAAPFEWASMDTDVATVSPLGTVTGVGAGVGEIIATSQGVSGSASIQIGVTAFVKTVSGRLQFSDTGPASHTLARYQGRIIAIPTGETLVGTPTSAVRLANGRVLVRP